MNVIDPERFAALSLLLGRYGLALVRVRAGALIPGSYWGAPEAGIVGRGVYARCDTPVHSVLHEAAHVVCMDTARRARVHTDAGGDFAEEDAVCYLQIVLASSLGIASESICADMDDWGYTFRLGSARAWFRDDAEDARTWLLDRGLITEQDAPTWRLRAA